MINCVDVYIWGCIFIVLIVNAVYYIRIEMRKQKKAEKQWEEEGK